MSPTDLSVSHVHHALLLQPVGVCSSRSFWVSCPCHRDWRHVKWYNLQQVQQTLEEMQQ